MSLRRFWPGLLALLVAFALGLWLWGQLPEQVPVHWNIRGEPDRWGSPATAVFLIPAIGFWLAVLLAVLPKLDPKRDSHALHGSAYRLTGNAILVFLAALHGVVLAASAGYPVRMDRVLPIGLGLLLAVIGNVLTQARQNWFFGIRTPWTLSSERAWRETHRLGGRLMVLGGLFLVAIGIFVPSLLPFGIVLGAVAPALVAVVYSYLVWKRDQTPEGRMS
jgi:uncharacterized membrane protein